MQKDVYLFLLAFLTVLVVCSDIGGQFWLPSIPIGEQLCLLEWIVGPSITIYFSSSRSFFLLLALSLSSSPPPPTPPQPPVHTNKHSHTHTRIGQVERFSCLLFSPPHTSIRFSQRFMYSYTITPSEWVPCRK